MAAPPPPKHRVFYRALRDAGRVDGFRAHCATCGWFAVYASASDAYRAGDGHRRRAGDKAITVETGTR